MHLKRSQLYKFHQKLHNLFQQMLQLSQTLTQKIRDLEKASIIEQYQEITGEIIVGEVYQVWRNEILVIHEDTELVLPLA